MPDTKPDKRRLKGPEGAIFVPSPIIDEHTITAKIKAGEWSEPSKAEVDKLLSRNKQVAAERAAAAKSAAASTS